jgi:hypothetical protein
MPVPRKGGRQLNATICYRLADMLDTARLVPIGIALAALTGCTDRPYASSADRPSDFAPNILLIVADDMG